MKRFLPVFAAIAAFVAVCFACVGCAGEPATPSQVVDSALKTIVAHDYANLQQYYAGDASKLMQDAEQAESSPSYNLGETAKKLTDEQKQRVLTACNKLAEFDYSLGAESIDGDTATVNVTFTNYDAGKAVQKLLQSYFTTMLSRAFSGSSASADASAEADQLVSAIENATSDLGEKNVTKDAVIKLQKDQNGEWKLADMEGDKEYSKQLVNGMFGGVVDSVQDMASSMLSSMANSSDSADESASE